MRVEIKDNVNRKEITEQIEFDAGGLGFNCPALVTEYLKQEFNIDTRCLQIK